MSANPVTSERTEPGHAPQSPAERSWRLHDARAGRIGPTKQRVGDGPDKRVWLSPNRDVGGYDVADLVYRPTEPPSGAEIVVVEGEPAADAVVAVGFHAVSFGSSSVRPSAAARAVLRAHPVVVWPDADRPGRTFASDLIKALEQDGATSVRLVEPDSDVESGWDAADADPGTIDTLIRTARRIDMLPPESIPASGTSTSTRSGARLIRMADVVPERVDWLWPSRIPLGKLTVLDGDPGLGKSTISIDLAARVSTGRAMPGEVATRPAAGVVLLSAEDGLADTIRPRLDAAGGDATQVVALAAVVGENGVERLPSLPIDLARLEAAIVENEAILVIVDVLMAFLDGAINAHRDQDVRGALAQLAAVAERTGAAVVVLRHLNKSSGGPAIYRGGGSIGIVGAARSALVVGLDPEDAERFVLAVTKANLARLAPSLTYRIVDQDGVGRIAWEGESNLTAAQLLAMPTSADERTALDDAKDVLREILVNGPIAAKDAQREARDAGVSDATLRRAKDALGVVAQKVGGRFDSAAGEGQHWQWSLPEGAQETLKALNPGVWTSSANREHLQETEAPAPTALRPVPEPASSATIDCPESKFTAHQTSHRQVPGGWVCDACREGSAS